MKINYRGLTIASFFLIMSLVLGKAFIEDGLIVDFLGQIVLVVISLVIIKRSIR